MTQEESRNGVLSINVLKEKRKLPLTVSFFFV